MNQITFNQWQEHIAKELRKNYVKLKMIKPDERNIPRVQRKKS
jgi:hypothetical protein